MASHEAANANDAHTPKRRRWVAGAVGYVLVIGAAAWSAYVNLNPHAHGYDIIVKGPAHIKDPYSVIDARMRFAAEKGNVLLLFEGLDAGTDPKLHSVAQFYCRGSYIVYPHRVYLGDDQLPFNNDQLSVA